MFKTFFGGGAGEMRMTGESNLNDSGIEIAASIPGKRLQKGLLLSGGEKSLTAMASAPWNRRRRCTASRCRSQSFRSWYPCGLIKAPPPPPPSQRAIAMAAQARAG